MKQSHTEYRARLRELILGFVEHCEFSQRLVGRIERFIEYRNQTYGLPLFSFYGPNPDNLETRFVGLVARNENDETAGPEALLQFIERISLQPEIASGLALSIVPVANPVALELGAEAPIIDDLPELSEQIRHYSSRWLDGLVEIQLGNADTPRIELEGPAQIREATAQAAKTMDRLDSVGVRSHLTCHTPTQIEGEERWTLRLTAPRAWSENLTTQWISQFLVVFFRTRAETVAKSGFREFESFENPNLQSKKPWPPGTYSYTD